MTARTATSVPTAEREASHWVACTLAELTDSGGGANDLPALIMVRICNPLIPTRTRITPRSAAMATIQVRRRLDGRAAREVGMSKDLSRVSPS